MAGLHVVRKSLKLHDRFYVYAWRGGPCIHTEDDKYPRIGVEILTKMIAARAKHYGENPNSFERLVIEGYKASPQFTMRASSTKVEYSRWLQRIADRFGATPAGAFNDRHMRADIIEWKNQWAHQPRTADSASMMMQTLLSWAVENAILTINVATKIKKIHSVDRSDMVWEDVHWDTWNKTRIQPTLNQVVFFAQWTGLRLGDLIDLRWEEVGPTAIIRYTNKSGTRKIRAVVPILPPIRAWIDAVPRDQRVGHVLRNSDGNAWKKDAISGAFQRNKPEGFNRTLHDLRGTFCTQLILKGLSDDQCAMVMGWKNNRVAEIRARYVDEAKVILHLADRISA